MHGRRLDHGKYRLQIIKSMIPSEKKGFMRPLKSERATQCERKPYFEIHLLVTSITLEFLVLVYSFLM
jgi:hypothetical protein